jgi:hypothetical protein
VLGVLEEILDGNAVVRYYRLPRKSDIPLENLTCAAANSYVEAVAVEGLIALR